jgi:hypothetical protein
MSSDRKAKVGWAIDLLRTHQLRRENAFLHGELQSCLGEITAMRDEIKDIKAATEMCRVTSTQALCLSEQHKADLEGQRHDVEGLRRDLDQVQTEVSGLKSACDQSHEAEQAQVAILRANLLAGRLDCQNRADVSQMQHQTNSSSIEALRRELEGKADQKTLDVLLDRMNRLRSPDPAAAPDSAMESVSRIQDTFERRGSEELPGEENAEPSLRKDKLYNGSSAGNGTFQVRASQQAKGSKDFRSPLSPSVTRDQTAKDPEPETILDDLDLDANAHTITYAGHHYHSAAEESGDLQFLPQPQAQAAQLAKLNTLCQKRFEDWEEYYTQAQMLVKELPHTFEETVVRKFADGIFKDAQRRQCRQWLDSEGWNWDNITSFGELCSQFRRPSEASAATTPKRPEFSKRIAEVLPRNKQTERRVQGLGRRRGPMMAPQPKPAVVPLRRSLRLVIKVSQDEAQSRQRRPDPDSPELTAPRQSGAGATQGRQDWGSISTPTGEIFQSTERHTAPSVQGFKERADTPPGVVRQINLEQQRRLTANSPQQNLDFAHKIGASHNDKTTSTNASQSLVASEIVPKNSKQTIPGLQDGENETLRSPIPYPVRDKVRTRELADDSSDDAGFLHNGQLGKRPGSPITTTRPTKRRKKKTRLPLPPPPEIPILSSSSD